MPRDSYQLCPACNRRKAVPDRIMLFGDTDESQEDVHLLAGLRCTAPRMGSVPACRAESIDGVVVRLPNSPEGRTLYKTDPAARAVVASRLRGIAKQLRANFDREVARLRHEIDCTESFAAALERTEPAKQRRKKKTS